MAKRQGGVLAYAKMSDFADHARAMRAAAYTSKRYEKDYQAIQGGRSGRSSFGVESGGNVSLPNENGVACLRDARTRRKVPQGSRESREAQMHTWEAMKIAQIE